MKKKGFQRLFINKKLYELDDIPTLNKNLKYDLELVIDRLITGNNMSNRLADSIELALSLSKGIVYVLDVDTNEREIFSANFACPVSGFTIEEIEPRLFLSIALLEHVKIVKVWEKKIFSTQIY